MLYLDGNPIIVKFSAIQNPKFSIGVYSTQPQKSQGNEKSKRETHFSSSFLSSSSILARIESKRVRSISKTESATRVSYKGTISVQNKNTKGN